MGSLPGVNRRVLRHAFAAAALLTGAALAAAGSSGAASLGTHKATVTVEPGGYVSSPQGGIVNCRSTTCYANYSTATYKLRAYADSGWRFDKWTGACAGADATCLVNNNADKTTVAWFAQTAPVPPGAPSNLTVAPAQTSLGLSWTAGSGATSYDVFLDGTDVQNVGGTSATISGLDCASDHTVGVEARNSAGTSSVISVAAATASCSAPRQADCNSGLCVLLYTPQGPGALLTDLEQNAFSNVDYFFTLDPCGATNPYPPGTTQCKPHADGPGLIRGGGSNFHPVAVFNWKDWAAVSVAGATPQAQWLARARLFRSALDASPKWTTGDDWALDEIPKEIRDDGHTTAAQRRQIRLDVEAIVQGLYGGANGTILRKGTLFAIGFPQQSSPTAYKADIEDWLSQSDFWSDLGGGKIRFFAQETYTSCRATCVAGSTVAARESHALAYTQAVARLANAQPGTSYGRALFTSSYVAVQNAVSDNLNYGNTDDLWKGAGSAQTTMDQLIHVQTDSQRLLSGKPEIHRLAFAWKSGLPDGPQSAQGASALAAGIDAWLGSQNGCPNADTCTPVQHAVAGPPAIPAGKFNEGWSTFSTW